jgi:hypothetical protein
MDIPFELVAAKRAAELALLALPGIVGVGLGMREVNGEFFDEVAVVVFVEDAAAVPLGLPAEVGGVAVCIVEREVEPCTFPDTARYDQLVGGVQVTNPLRGLGTLGAVVEDTATGDLLGLSCYHVVGDAGQSFPDTIWQPTNPPLVQGAKVSADDNIGEVVRTDFPRTHPLPFSPIQVGMSDAAVVTLDAARTAGRTISRAIVGPDGSQPNLVDALTATAVANVNDRVRKRGFRTGPTHGAVVLRYLTLQWKPGGPNCFLMEQSQVLGDAVFCEPGDSGSLVLEESGPTAVGLLWGQSAAGTFAPAGKLGYMSEIGNVEAALGVSVVWA